MSKRKQCDKYYNLGKSYLAKAIAADSADSYNQAIVMYDLACENFIAGLKFDTHKASRQLVIKRVKSYLARAELLQVTLREQAQAKRLNTQQPTPLTAEEDSGLMQVGKSMNKEGGGGITFDDVAGLGNVKSVLKEAVMLPMLQPQIFQGARKPFKGILLYGPPGTGKTLVAKALAGESSANFLSLSSADIVSKAQGESEKAIRKVFEAARNMKPCVIFFDEIDSIGGTRTDGDDGQYSESMRRVLTELLRQLDGVGTESNEGVTLVAATNLPFELDPALRRRFEKRVYVPLPDEKTRAKVLAIHFGDGSDGTHELTTSDFREAAKATEGCSNADLAVAAKDALMAPVRRCMKAAYFRETWHFSVGDLLSGRGFRYLVPCGPNDPGAKPMRMFDAGFEAHRLRVPAVTASDLRSAIAQLRPTVSKTMLGMYEKFTDKFGERSKRGTVEEEDEDEETSVDAAQSLPQAPTSQPKLSHQPRRVATENPTGAQRVPMPG